MRRAAIVLAIIAVAAQSWSFADREDVRILLEQTLADAEYQLELPAAESIEVERAETSRVSRPLFGEGPDHQPRSHLGDLLGRVLMLAMIIAISAIFLWVLAEAVDLRRQSRRQTVTEAREAEARVDGSAPGSVAQADGLAERGLYGEAVRLLLGLAISGLARTGEVIITPSLTGREVIRLAPDRESLRRLLAILVAAVEQSLFGGLDLGADDYSRCKDAFDRLNAGVESPS